MPTIRISENSVRDYTGITDTQIKESAATTNYATNQFMEATSFGSGDNTRALLAIASPALGGAITVSAVSLGIYQESAAAGTRTLDLFKLLRGADTATWNTYDGTNNWGTAGATGVADYDSTALVSASITTTSFEYKTWSSSGLIAYVQAQINAAAAMLFMLARNPITAPPNDFTFNNFRQSSASNADGTRPYLDVTYTLDAPAGQYLGTTEYF